LIYWIRAFVSLAARRRLDELERALWATTESTLDALGNGDFYFIAGIVHLRDVEAFLPKMHQWVPAPREVILSPARANSLARSRG